MAPRPEKVAVVEEVRERLASSDAVLLTEYRGLTVKAMTTLRRSLREAGADYVVYKNTLVSRAADELGLDFGDLLTGPTALAFVRGDGGDVRPDPVAVAKALRTFAQTNDKFVVKGGMLGARVLSADDIEALSKVAPREELLARLAGGLAAPMVQFAGLLQAVPARFAYALAALIEAGGATGAPAPEAAPAAEPEPEPEAAPAAEAAPDTETEEAAPAESPGQDDTPEE
jgi:large subunit ribosomal protein L10